MGRGEEKKMVPSTIKVSNLSGRRYHHEPDIITDAAGGGHLHQ
jgi:hypothetical protein